MKERFFSADEDSLFLLKRVVFSFDASFSEKTSLALSSLFCLQRP